MRPVSNNGATAMFAGYPFGEIDYSDLYGDVRALDSSCQDFD